MHLSRDEMMAVEEGKVRAMIVKYQLFRPLQAATVSPYANRFLKRLETAETSQERPARSSGPPYGIEAGCTGSGPSYER